MKITLRKPFCTKGRVLGFSPAHTIYVGYKHDLMEVDQEGNCVARRTIPETWWMEACSSSRLWCRLTRYEIRAFGRFTDGAVAAATRDNVYFAGPKDTVMQAARLPRLSRPIRFPMSMTVGPQSRVLWGEYWANRERTEVHILCSFDHGRSYEPVKTFSPGEVRHIHGIWPDPFEDGYWVLTGDEDNESGIGWLSGDFRNFEWRLHGNQQYRAVVIFPFRDRLVYATDTEKDFNFIYTFDRNTGKVEKNADLSGSCMNGCQFGGWYVLSTTVEKFKTGGSRFASLWVSRDGADWQRVWEKEKDIWPLKYFQYGSIILPRVGWDLDTIVMSGQALKGIDNRVLLADVAEDV